MSIPVVKCVPGAPKEFKVGMVLKSGNRVELMGTESHNFRVEGVTFTMLDGSPIEAHGQLVDAYVLEWLGNDGIVKGVSR